ncbi:MAG: hypothetical protein PHD46_04420 [Eubacteriales bacterium]|nr:hypothetical protein [Eubacteriales bacterium]MDD4422265.1 hypothetical protein [Eubacteriales bacterium]HBR30547.1 hypothetical protein [Clostridiales bacterium]
MTINKLYSKKILLYKLVYAVCLPFLTELIAMLFDYENPVIYLFSAMFMLGLLYTAPFALTLRALRRAPINKKAGESLRKIIFNDLVYVLIPIILSTILCDVVFLIIYPETKYQGVFSALVISIVVLITLSFWLLYRLFMKKTKTL